MREWLRYIRTSESLTQEQVARLISVDITSVNKYELGHRRPSPEVAQRLAGKLNFNKYGHSWVDFFQN